MRLIVAITGASGVIYGRRLLEALQRLEIETHLIITKTAEKVIEHELGANKRDFEGVASYAYDMDNLLAPITSGSFRTEGMVIIPCSMKTLAGIVHGYSENLVLRVADVMLKEKRRLILVPRETPLNVIHLRNMLALAELGVVIVPAMPAYYHEPKSIDDLVDFVVGRVLDCLVIKNELYKRWVGRHH